jgi:TRAP-type C4-dicarboxylate transport system substrate-binding protein
MQIDRRTLLATSLIPPAAFAAEPALVGANAPPNTPFEKQWKRFAANAGQAGVPVKLMTSGELGGDEGILASLRRNRIQVGGFTLAAMANVVPEFALLTIPYLFDSAAEAAYVQDITALTVFEPLLREKGLSFLQWTDSGWAGVFSLAPIRVPADVRGKKLRAAPAIAHRTFLEVIGADVVPLGTADIIPSLQTGLIVGGVTTTSYYGPAFSDMARFFTRTRHYPEGGAVVANGAWFGGLSAEQQVAMRRAFGAPAQVRAEIAEADAEISRNLTATGVTFIDLTEGERTEWVEASRAVEEQLVTALGGKAPQVLIALKDARADFRKRGA